MSAELESSGRHADSVVFLAFEMSTSPHLEVCLALVTIHWQAIGFDLL
jgi:hypothetical protein